MDRLKPTRRAAMSLLAAGAGATASPAWVQGRPLADERSVIARIDAEIDRAVQQDDFSGAVMVSREGRTVFSRAVGLADRDYAAPNRIDTRFNFASIGKLFTGAAILRLVEQGRVQLDAPFATWLPDYPDADIARQVSLAHLLSHSSGLGNYWEAIAHKAPHDYVRLTDHLPLFQGVPLAFEPGSRYAYSNVGFVVLGLVIEAVTGAAFQDHIERTLFQPLGMPRPATGRSTWSFPGARPASPATRPHRARGATTPS